MKRRTTTMNATRIVPEAEAGFEELQPHLELLLVYEDVPTALRAKRALDHVLSGAESRAHYHIHAWKLDLLRQPDCFYGQAIHDALAADIVVLSTHGNNGLPLEAMCRLIQWVGLKRDTPCALVISLDPDVKPFTEETPGLTELCSAAARNNVTVISHSGEPLDFSPNAALAEVPRHAATAAGVPAAITPQDYLRPAHWGINE